MTRHFHLLVTAALGITFTSATASATGLSCKLQKAHVQPLHAMPTVSAEDQSDAITTAKQKFVDAAVSQITPKMDNINRFLTMFCKQDAINESSIQNAVKPNGIAMIEDDEWNKWADGVFGEGAGTQFFGLYVAFKDKVYVPRRVLTGEQVNVVAGHEFLHRVLMWENVDPLVHHLFIQGDPAQGKLGWGPPCTKPGGCPNGGDSSDSNSSNWLLNGSGATVPVTAKTENLSNDKLVTADDKDLNREPAQAPAAPPPDAPPGHGSKGKISDAEAARLSAQADAMLGGINAAGPPAGSAPAVQGAIDRSNNAPPLNLPPPPGAPPAAPQDDPGFDPKLGF